MKDKNSRMENDWKYSIKDTDNTNTVKALTDEIQRLRRLISKITENMTWGNSVVKVIFRDEFYEEKYRSKMENFLKDILDKDENFTLNSQIYDKGEQEFSKLQPALEAERLITSSSTGRKTANTVPLYSSAFEDVLHCDKPKPEEENTEEKVQTMTCFNCLGDHHMKDCHEKINRSRIAENRKDILMENSIRYHEEEKKNSIKPGTISSEMRKALSLKDSQLPPYIYKMRVIGYPPGWMDNAKLETSGLSLYDEEGKATSDGESSYSSESGKKFDSRQFIEYPGFNCPVPPNVKDEWKSMGMVPIQAHQQLTEVLKAEENTTNSNNTNKRKSVNSSEEDDDAKKIRNGTNDANVSFSHLSPENCSTPKKQDSRSLNTSNGTPIQKSLGTSLSHSPGSFSLTLQFLELTRTFLDSLTYIFFINISAFHQAQELQVHFCKKVQLMLVTRCEYGKLQLGKVPVALGSSNKHTKGSTRLYRPLSNRQQFYKKSQCSRKCLIQNGRDRNILLY